MQVRLEKKIVDRLNSLATVLNKSSTVLANEALQQMLDLCDARERSVPLMCELVDTARRHAVHKKPLVYSVRSNSSSLNDGDK